MFGNFSLRFRPRLIFPVLFLGQNSINFHSVNCCSMSFHSMNCLSMNLQWREVFVAERLGLDEFCFLRLWIDSKLKLETLGERQQINRTTHWPFWGPYKTVCFERHVFNVTKVLFARFYSTEALKSWFFSQCIWMFTSSKNDKIFFWIQKLKTRTY